MAAPIGNSAADPLVPVEAKPVSRFAFLQGDKVRKGIKIASIVTAVVAAAAAVLAILAATSVVSVPMIAMVIVAAAATTLATAGGVTLFVTRQKEEKPDVDAPDSDAGSNIDPNDIPDGDGV